MFSTTFGTKPVNGFSKAKGQLDRAMRAEMEGALEHFVIHDIRRTMRTGLSALCRSLIGCGSWSSPMRSRGCTRSTISTATGKRSTTP